MGTDYYELLGVARDADEAALKKAYRKAAIKWHPDKNPGNKEVAEKKFKEVAQAYATLSNPNDRATYDRFGEAGLKRAGSAGPSGFGGMGGMPGGIDPNDLFSQMFGQMGGMPGGGIHVGGMPGGAGIDLSEVLGQMFGGAAGGMGGRGRQQAVMERKVVRCTLEELYCGARRVETHNGRSFTLDIQPGWKAGTKLTFEEARVVFEVAEAEHRRFTRRGNDLVTVASPAVTTLFSGSTQRLQGLNGREIAVGFAPFRIVATQRGGGMPFKEKDALGQRVTRQARRRALVGSLRGSAKLRVGGRFSSAGRSRGVPLARPGQAAERGGLVGEHADAARRARALLLLTDAGLLRDHAPPLPQRAAAGEEVSGGQPRGASRRGGEGAGGRTARGTRRWPW